jgi:DNA polymerase III epsilon subunit-like protein
MQAIFFDLETSDTNPIGQILNYSFILVDRELNLIDELNGEIRVSCLQLPTPGAILANKTDILEHQQRASLAEHEAMRQIFEFIKKSLPQKGSLALVGYNSNKFDLVHLRTALIRNGFNPYFGGQLVYRDLLHAVRKLACCDSKFPRLASRSSLPGEAPRLSLSLETVATAFGLLDGPQSHHSRADVLLTIELARILKKQFALDIISFEAYEPLSFHKGESRGKVAVSLAPNYDLESGTQITRTPFAILDSNNRYALWIDLERYKAGHGERSINWFNPAIHHFFVQNEIEAPVEEAVVSEALNKFAHIKLSNFFSDSVCDIEQDIYRVDFDGMEALRQIIWDGADRRKLRDSSRDVQVLALRAELRIVDQETPRLQEVLRKYAVYRYGGQCNISKSNTSEKYVEGLYSRHFHPTFNELLDEIDLLSKTAGPVDRKLLESLRQFYYESRIYRVAGQELSTIRRARPVEPEFANFAPGPSSASPAEPPNNAPE